MINLQLCLNPFLELFCEIKRSREGKCAGSVATVHDAGDLSACLLTADRRCPPLPLLREWPRICCDGKLKQELALLEAMPVSC
jgi:hypothetical protein